MCTFMYTGVCIQGSIILGESDGERDVEVEKERSKGDRRKRDGG